MEIPRLCWRLLVKDSKADPLPRPITPASLKPMEPPKVLGSDHLMLAEWLDSALTYCSIRLMLFLLEALAVASLVAALYENWLSRR